MYFNNQAIIIGSTQKESADVLQIVFPKNTIFHADNLLELQQILKAEGNSTGLIILEDSITIEPIGQVITGIRETYRLPIVAALTNPNPKTVGNAILSGANGIIRGQIVDTHEIFDAVNDALLAY